MQVNEFNTGWFRKRFVVSCTLMAADMPALESELAIAKEEIQHAMEFHQHRCAKVMIVVASGQKSSRDARPAMRERLESDVDLRAIARQCGVTAAFLTRMGDTEGRFKIRKS
ncbi:hypothetical protein BH10PLA1_BH10PLA1_11410 [soil metagenome]